MPVLELQHLLKGRAFFTEQSPLCTIENVSGSKSSFRAQSCCGAPGEKYPLGL